MNISEVKSILAGESYYRINHSSGLPIYVYPKKGYKSAYAIFGTRYGSINNVFSVDSGEKITVPDGIAHYLEHKLFESEDGDAFVRYAKTGANANAYTSFDKTCYLFSCTGKFDESLEILLDFVQSPYFTAKTVEKEQGIIGQEIKMYDDSPDWRVLFNMLEAMYENHPVKIDIAGTVESIAQITAEKLYEVYNVFYNLNNMVLCVAGNVTVEQVMKIADKMLKPCKKHEIHCYFQDEPDGVLKPYVEQSFPVSIPLFNLGFKEKPDCCITEKQKACTDILLSMLASPTSTLYRNLMNEGLINTSFSYEPFEGPGFFTIIFSGESREPQKTADRIKEYISDMKKNGLDKEDFEIAKKAIYGGSVSALNSVSTIGNLLIDHHFNDNEIYTYLDEVAKAQFSDVEEMFSHLLDVDNCTLSVISEIKGE